MTHSILKPHPRVLRNDEIEAIASRRNVASTEISRVCSGERRWTMCIPVQDDDSDVVLEQALQDSQRLEKEVYRLRGAIKSVTIGMELPDDVREALNAILFGTEDNSA